MRRELRAFVFVFYAANRIVVETPAYGNATFFFEIEQPMPVAQQVRLSCTPHDDLRCKSSAWRLLQSFRWYGIMQI